MKNNLAVADALALAAGEFERVAAEILAAQANQFDQLVQPFTDRSTLADAVDG